MKNYLLLLFIACQSYTVLAQSDNQQPYMTKSLSGAAIKEVFVKTSGGSITVSGAGNGAPRVEVYINGNNGNKTLSKDEIAKRLENYILDVAVNGSEVHAIAKNKGSGVFNWNNSLNISFKVFVTKQVGTNLNTSGGSIRLDNLVGKQDFETSGGSLNIDQVTGAIHGRTSGGSIHVSNSGQDIDLQTSGGSINAANCQGQMKLETSGGSLHLEALKGTINATTSGGSIQASNISGELVTGTSGGSINLSQLSCALDASTSAGSFHAQFNSIGKYVKIDVSSGNVELQLPAKQGVDLNIKGDKINSDFAGNFKGNIEKEKVQGKLNGGGALVEVRGNGRVNLSLN
ncbi:DUF4097 family beta strand repeat-containing protein [Mucilaginibacter sp. SP1R1]|uniref:DUF4097 family beta strand repeat-containing protein n=1 Tax=Mucilaginibacter sp. SP1R1 TaxID=2723091 RepID=UPI00160DDB3F|nr:DUF4097 family beta strand repeat-containing protein [Mucilaginibacter sp. SP1R1]MBB6148772.1 hypothetical protein [Mucilaginibacter sp. SP1R1]